METSSAYSESYIAVEQRIRGGELSLSELEHLLDRLVSQEQITSAEEQALLELAWNISTNAMPASKDV
jgi:hypothetical protein